MRIWKSTIALLAVMAILCGILPLSAIVQASEGFTPVIAVKVNIDTPEGGREASFHATCSAAPSSDGAMVNVNYDKPHFYHGVQWYDCTTNAYLKEGDTFVTGHEYDVIVIVRVSNPGFFYMVDDVIATLNQEEATVVRQNTLQISVAYKFPACAAAPPDVTHVSIHNLSYPVAGRYAEYDAVVGDMLAYEVKPVDNDYYINGVAWYNQNYMALRDNIPFKEGETYLCIVQLKVKHPYRFAVDANGLSTMTADIMGFPAEVYSSYQNNDYMDSQVLIRCSFDCVTAQQFHDAIDNVRVNSEYPVGGKTVSFKAEIPSQTYYIRTEQNVDANMVNGISWYDRTTGRYLSKGSKFQKGHEYTFSTVVSTVDVMNKDYWFSAVDLGDGTAVSCVNGYVNSFPARIEPFGDMSVAQMLRVSVDYPACGDSAMTINRITLKDVDPPVEGRIADLKGTLEFGYAEDGVLPTSKEVVLTWITKGGAEMAADETFELGMPYGVCLKLESGLLADFAMKKEGEFDIEEGVFDGDVIASGSYASYTESPSGTTKAMNLVIAYLSMEEQPPVTKIDIVGLIPPAEGEHPRFDVQFAQDSLPFVGDVHVSWYYSVDGVTTYLTEDETFKSGVQYAAEILVTTKYPYEFDIISNGRQQVTATVNGKTQIPQGVTEPAKKLKLVHVFEVLTADPSVIDYAEVDGIMRPAPGQKPDFTADVNSAYAQFGGISWYEIGEDGKYASAALGVNDVFLEDTRYRAEIRLTAPDGKVFNLDNRTNSVNNEDVLYYYNSDTSVTLYIEYDTSNCITDINFSDVQYPIGGKTPDDEYHLETNTENDGWDYDIEWYYETNPGTPSAGFSRLDGKFKTDRRHQVYVEYIAPLGYWLATDRDGKLAVNATIDQREVDFAYATDISYDNGICSAIEVCETFEIAKNVNGVFVDGMWLTDGLYLSGYAYGIFTEENVNKEFGYAYYNDGVLTLHDLDWTCYGDYDAIASYHDLTVNLEGENRIESYSIGISTREELTLTGDEDAYLYLCADQYGVFTNSTMTVEGGNWDIEAFIYDGIWLYSTFTMNGGYMSVRGKTSGIYGDDWPAVAVNGGTLIAQAPTEDAIAWCDVQTADGAVVTVSESSQDEAVAWDGTTSFAEYTFVCITFDGDAPNPPTALLGDVNLDEAVDMFDVLRLFKHVNEEITLESAEEALADVNDDTEIDMFDVLRLFKFVNEEIDEL